MSVIFLFFCGLILSDCDAAKILGVFSAPSISHQVVFRPFTQELGRRGHNVTIVTTDPAFAKNNVPENLTEIDVHDMLYAIMKANYDNLKVAEYETMYSKFDEIFKLINNIIETFLKSEVVDKLRGQHFDLLITEALHKPILVLAHILNVPVMQISSFGSMYDYETVGAPVHPALYPEITTQRISNLTAIETIHETITHVMVTNSMYSREETFQDVIKKNYPSIPPFNDLRGRVTTLLLNVAPIWEENRAIPVGVSYISGVHRWPKRPMSEELKAFIDSSKNGVIYMSFGTNVNPSLLPNEKIQILLNAVAKLPQNILLKWDQDALPWTPKNVKVSKWFPQIAILDHPNVKLFITQCGLQSTEEAIDAGMPLLGIPFLFDQWANAEKYVRHKIGLKLDIETLTEETLLEAVNTIIGDNSYRENVARFRTLMRDQPHSALHTAIWWTEYAIKYSGSPHLRSAAANMPWTQYFEVELVLIVLAITVVGCAAVLFLVIYILRRFLSVSKKILRIKINKKTL